MTAVAASNSASGSSTVLPEQLEQAPDLGRFAAGDAEHAPPHLDRDVGHHPEDIGAREGGADALQRGGAEQRDERLRRLADLGGGVAAAAPA